MHKPTSPSIRRRSLLLAAAVIAALGATAPLAVQAFDENSKSPINVDQKNLMLRGHDPVAYFKQQAAVKGSPNFSATHEGATYHFATAENRDQFKANPARYAPQYGGYCAMGVALGKKLDGDPEVFRVVNDRLYLNVNRDVQQKWLQDTKGSISKADTTWPSIRDKTPREIN